MNPILKNVLQLILWLTRYSIPINVPHALERNVDLAVFGCNVLYSIT